MKQALGHFEQMVLFAILALEDIAYGAEIRREIESRTGKRVLVGAVYMALDRLERQKLVKSATSEPTPQRGGRRRKLYVLLPAGAKLLATADQQYRSMADGLLTRLRDFAPSGQKHTL